MSIGADVRAVVGRVLGRIVVPVVHRVTAPALAWRLERRNLSNQTPVTGDTPAIVSLTTFGQRFQSVHLAIESIASGRARPRRLILWLDDPELLANLTPGLRRLVARGLEIKLTRRLGPHAKYYPTLAEFVPNDGLHLVTADDDILYPAQWLDRLWRCAASHPGEVACYRAHVVRLLGERVAPYSSWQPCWEADASLLHFATGVSGVAYPPAVIDGLRAAGDGFLRTAPKADDVWLHAVTVGMGVRIRQQAWRPRVWPVVPGSQEAGLFQSNVLESGNDTQIAAVYTPELVSRLVVEGTHT